ncbi:MAG TPA: hypothetical protein VJ914_16240 [Pseudonocardiaceae bacterium]|nr:hypothetical protein [Pseudonocardiaceae bacterium]
MAVIPTTDTSSTAKPGSSIRRNAGLWAVLGGLLVLLLVAGFAIFHYGQANDAATVITAVGGVVGTLVGAFFGVHVGASVGTQAQQSALDTMRQNTNQLVQTAVNLDPNSDAATKLLATLK